MRTAFIALLATALAAYGYPKFVTPEMTLRNGLTDEQFEKLWSLGKHPSVDTQTARNWMFRASRYENTTNWFSIIGRTNNFARLVLQQADQLEKAAADVTAAKAAQSAAESKARTLEGTVAGLTAEKAAEAACLADDVRYSDDLIAALRAKAALWTVVRPLEAAYLRELVKDEERRREGFVRRRDSLGE